MKIQVVGDNKTIKTELHEEDGEWTVVIKLHPTFEAWIDALSQEITLLNRRVRKLEGWHE